MDLIIIFFLIVSSLLIFLLFGLKQYPNLPPGPPRLPLIGNMHQILGSVPLHRVFRDLAKKHGPIMHIQLAQMSVIVISSPRLAKEVLKTHNLEFANRPNTLASRILLYGNKDIAYSPYSDYWRQLRKICSLQLLSLKKVRSFSAIREQEFKRFMKSLRLLPDGEAINFHDKVAEIVNSVVCVSSVGDNCRQQTQLLEVIHECSKEMCGFCLSDFFPKYYEFVSMVMGNKSKLLKLRKNIDKVLGEILEERLIRRKSVAADDKHEYEDLLEDLLRIKEEGGAGFEITNDNIKAIILDMFVAGTDTVSLTIQSAMTAMIRNPIMMKKVQTEVREAFKGKTTITEKDLQSLSYLQLVIKETLRLHLPTPLLLPRACREQCKIDGYDISVNQQVVINAWACATDPDHWENAESFKPERFENSSIDFMGNDYELIPFGAGKRMCPGIAFALRSVEFFLAHMLYFYDWNLPDGLNPNDSGNKDQFSLVPTFYPKAVEDALFRNLKM